MVGSKLITIQVPFIFKEIIDVCHTDLVTTGEAGQTLAEVAAEPSFFVPAAIVLGYGVARSSAVAFSELRNSIFSTVALRATRQVSLDVFTHLQARELQFHLDREIGTLSRVMDRGGRSINSALSSMLFSVVPTALEIGMVSAILGTQFGVAHSAVTALTVGAYTVFTINYSNTRIPIRKEMNDAENEAHQRSIDALVNYETVKYFGAEKLEEDRYNESLVKYSEAAQRTQKTLTILNVGQNVIFSAGLTAIMGLTTASIVSGDATVGDLVLVNGLLFQVGHRLCCVFYTGGQVPELVV
jgi:ABC-type transport system involved in Fe-S cluster assembly fused permease/ATPase subunit